MAGTEGLGVGSDVTFMGKGSNETPGAKVDLSEQLGNKIVKNDVSGTEGLGRGGDMTLVGAGSSATPGAQVSLTDGQDKIVKQ